MSSLRDLARQLTDEANSLPLLANDASKAVSIAIVRDLVSTTPVDSSKAISNWVVGIGAPNRAIIDPYFHGSQGSTQELSAASAIANAQLALAKKLPGQAVYISNNLPYIRRLNDGYSTQAPAGWVERAVLIGRKVVAAFRKVTRV